MINQYEDIVASIRPRLRNPWSDSFMYYRGAELTPTGIARMVKIRPHTSNSHSGRSPSRVMDETSTLLVFATTRWPNSESDVNEHLREPDTDEGG